MRQCNGCVHRCRCDDEFGDACGKFEARPMTDREIDAMAVWALTLSKGDIRFRELEDQVHSSIRGILLPRSYVQ